MLWAEVSESDGVSAEMGGSKTSPAALRSFITDRLSAASRDILAAVDRLVAEFEEEASGLRRQISRQKEQLEVLQPRVELSRGGVTRCRSLGPVEEGEGEDEEPPKHLENLDSTSPSRSLPPSPQNGGRAPGRPRISETKNHIHLRIRILEDPQTAVLSKNVLKKCPALQLRCPPGLQEANFLRLLRSTFPQLAGDDQPFDVLASDRRRRLLPLKLKALTAEEILRNMSGAGWRTPAVHLRLKKQKEPQSTDGSEIRPQVIDPASTSREKPSMVSRSLEEVEGCGADAVSSSSTSQQDMETEETDGEACGTSEAAVAPSAAAGKDDVCDIDEVEDEREEVNDDNRTPDESEELESKKQEATHFCVGEMKTENSAPLLSCKVCGALHRSESVLAKHARSHESESVCGVCGESSESVESLKVHLQSHHETHDCHICGESFLSVLGLDEHVAAHSGVCQKIHKEGERHRCYICHKVFDHKEQLKTHRKTHSNRKTHLCGVCGKSLSDYRSLSRHMMIHSGERPHSCQVCGKRFKLPGTLRQHEKIHTDRERSYLCDVCCKMFLTSQQLHDHMRTHTNEKLYHCGECGRGFIKKGALTIHTRVHTGESPYRCPHCGWSFKRKSNLDEHMTIHTGVKPFVCGICGKACARKVYLTVHMRTHNGERPYKCTVCDKVFTQSHCLKSHMKSHQGAESAT